MVFEQIEKLKREFTDKYVVVDATCAELRRFEGQTGLIRTVNMNGRALVEFDGFENIGWYDIALDFLRVVDKPEPKEEPKPAKKPAAKKAAPAKAEKAAAKPAAKPAGGGGKMSVADMLAAARSEKPAGEAQPAAAKPKAAPAAAKPAAATKPGQAMSVADMLAAARSEKSGGTEAPTQPPEPEAAPDPEPAQEPAAAAEPAPAASGDLPTDTAGICAYCRATDG